MDEDLQKIQEQVDIQQIDIQVAYAKSISDEAIILARRQADLLQRIATTLETTDHDGTTGLATQVAALEARVGDVADELRELRTWLPTARDLYFVVASLAPFTADKIIDAIKKAAELMAAREGQK